ncbi:rlmN1 [Symbiodinium sp. CCMP2592]|nr:rlmN1 [Symbiodinium sp. CCMP2592]
MASAAAFWEYLRIKGLSDVAPACVRAEALSIDAVRERSHFLEREGVQRWQLELLLAAPTSGGSQLALPRQREDLPPIRKRKRASFQDAIAAAAPAERAQALQELDDEILAKTTVGPMESRLLVWRRLCEAWEVPSFPLDEKNIRAIGASLKRGRYRSAAQYYSAAISFQARRLHMPVQPFARAMIKDCIRSIKRGFFQLVALAPFVLEGSEYEAFSWASLPAAIDALIVASYWCLREIEMAGADGSHLYFRDGMVHLLLPVHKTATQGSLTERSPGCGCAVRRQPLCPYHAAQRHLQRLKILQGSLNLNSIPLFPSDSGKVLPKDHVVQFIRRTLQAAGITTTRQDEVGQQVERFGGHVLRVTGTQHLYLLGLRWDLVQLHGTWSSDAIQRYLQAALLLQVPGVVAQALSAGPQQMTTAATSPVTGLEGLGAQGGQASVNPAVDSCAPPIADSPLAGGSSPRDVAALRVQFRSLTEGAEETETLIPATGCGILYGNARFFRTRADRPEWAKCKRCFPPDSVPVEGALDGSESEGADPSSLDSSSSSRRLIVERQLGFRGSFGGWGTCAASQLSIARTLDSRLHLIFERAILRAAWTMLWRQDEPVMHMWCFLKFGRDGWLPAGPVRGRLDFGTSGRTLAALAPDDSKFREIFVDPLLSGFKFTGGTLQVSEPDKPIAAAVMLYMRQLAIKEQSTAPSAPAGATRLAGTPTPKSPSATPSDDKVPRTLPPGVWADKIKRYEAITINGRSRSFPQKALLGDEASLAKLWHQLMVSRAFSPLPLGELMSRRSFDATGGVNALSKRKAKNELVVDVDRLVAEEQDESWEVYVGRAGRPQCTKMGLRAVGLFDILIQRARQRPQQLENFRAYYESTLWQLCTELRSGRTFAEAVAVVRDDVHLYQEVMAKTSSSPSKAGLDKKRKHEESPNKPDNKRQQADKWRQQGDQSGKWQQQRWRPPPVRLAPTPKYKVTPAMTPQEPASSSWQGSVDAPTSGGSSRMTRRSSPTVGHSDDVAKPPPPSALIPKEPPFPPPPPGIRAPPPPPPEDGTIEIIHLDFFSGIGTASIALQRLMKPIRCTFQWEIDEAVIRVAKRATRKLVVSHRGNIKDDDPAAVAKAVLAVRGGENDIILITAAAPCPDFSRLRADPQGREGPSGQLYVHFTEFLKKLVHLLPGRRACLVSENVVMQAGGDIQFFSKELKAEAVMIDAADFKLVSRPRLWWTWVSWQEVKRYPGTTEPLPKLKVPADSARDVQPQGLRFHQSVLDGTHILPCLTTPALTEAGREPPKKMKSKIDSATRQRWLEGHRQWGPWNYEPQNMLTDSRDCYHLLPAETKEGLHHLDIGITVSPHITEKDRHRLLGNSWHAGVAQHAIDFALRYGVIQLPGPFGARGADTSQWRDLSSAAKSAAAEPLSMRRAPEMNVHAHMVPVESMWEHSFESFRAVHPILIAPQLDRGLEITIARLVDMGPERFLTFRDRVLADVRNLRDSMHEETLQWHAGLPQHTRRAYTLPDGYIVQIPPFIALLRGCGYKDCESLEEALTVGFPVTGRLERSPGWRMRLDDRYSAPICDSAFKSLNHGYVVDKLQRGRVDPAWHTLLQEVLQEVHLGRMRGPFQAPSHWPRRCVSVHSHSGFEHCIPLEAHDIRVAGAFSVTQTGSDGQKKVRRCEDYRRSFHNSTILAEDVPAHDTIQTYVGVLQALHNKGLWAAYRQFPLRNPNEAFTLLALLATPTGPTLWNHSVLPFGATSSVWCFNGCVDALGFLARCILLILIIHYVDDVGGPDAAFSAQSSFRVVQALQQALAEDSLEPDVAQKLAGKLNFLQSTLFGQAGAAALRPLYARGHETKHDASCGLKGALRCSMKFLIRLLTNFTPRWFPFNHASIEKAVVYADAFFQLGDAKYGLSDEPPTTWHSRSSCMCHSGWGFIVRTTSGVRYGFGSVPAEVLSFFTSRKAFIYALEIMAQIVAAVSCHEILCPYWLGFCDNSAGKAALAGFG